MASINPRTATEYYLVEIRAPPPDDANIMSTEYDTREQAVAGAKKIEVAAERLRLALPKGVRREGGELTIWRVRATTSGNRLQMNVVPEDEW